MYTIHQGINGGWYGSVTCDDPSEALDAARALAAALDTLRADHPRKPARAPSEPATSVLPPADTSAAPALNEAGAACLAFCRANPRCKHDEYTAAGHTLRTVKWLTKHGYMKSVDGEWAFPSLR